ncbi:hypothetical protein J27TS8_21910 [Robertmurraya siralis]|uniref:ABC-2 family transporter protein n=1 Tax=Robertmurraya siralis TaxID=77777 RepID=A0A919WI34_9BACI|nr:hypothetical protein [Robertmurraya siralis]PAE20272.1 hypothetical protein CHH80_11770 [Bacillus sp. 7504-2]GIN62198.1 hypothetical protein J27TS8_21910 [Robertmurraya siralis]
MNRYLKLVNFEFERFFRFYLILIGITILSEIIGIIVKSKTYLNRAHQEINVNLMPQSEFIEQFGKMSIYNFSQSGWFMGPIALCIVTLLIYVFFIWYRDWFGKNTFSYRLFMLPTERMNIYFAKATTIILFVLGLVALQILLFPIEIQLLKWLVPSEFRIDMTVPEITENLYYLYLLFPKTLIEFILYYGTGIIAVFVIFTAILFERSYRLKGIFYAIIYVAVSILVFLGPALFDAFVLEGYFYTIELFLLEIGAALLVLAGAIWVGNKLIKHKIRV